MDKLKLEYEMGKNGISKADMCTYLGISRSAFYRKCNGISEFTVKEVQDISRLLHLENPMEIFLSNKFLLGNLIKRRHNMIKTFHNAMFGNLRTVTRDGEPWFVAADVCRVLGLEQVSRAMARLDDDEKGLLKVTHPQKTEKQMDVNAVNEPGLYRLVLNSNKPQAKAFKRWLTHEVIPALRKDGIYATAELMADREQLLEQVNTLLDKQKELADALSTMESENDRLYVDVSEQMGKAKKLEETLDWYRNAEDSLGLCNLRMTALNLGLEEADFIQRCLDRKYLYRDHRGRIRPYAKHIHNGKWRRRCRRVIMRCLAHPAPTAGWLARRVRSGRRTFPKARSAKPQRKARSPTPLPRSTYANSWRARNRRPARKPRRTRSTSR